VNRDDARVVQGGDRLRLALEPLARNGVVGKDRREQLQRHAAVESGVFGYEDLSHAAPAEGFDDLVVAYRVAGLHARILLDAARARIAAGVVRTKPVIAARSAP
jgi:hypothetical protein